MNSEELPHAILEFPRHFRALLRRLSWRFWITFLVACLVSFVGEYFLDVALESHEPSFTDSLLIATGMYQKIVTAPRHPIARFTAIVEIDPTNDPMGVSDSDVCDERVFLSKLLPRIDAANPAMIVIDKYFGDDVCPPDGRTEKLVDSIAAIQMHRPVVLGSRTELSAGGADNTDSYVFTKNNLHIVSEGPHFRHGIINVAADTRRLPLTWFVSDSLQSANTPTAELPGAVADYALGSPLITCVSDQPQRVRVHGVEPRDTFALATAKLYDPCLFRKNPILERMSALGDQPFIGFLAIDQFKYAHIYASQICGERAPSCNGNASVPAAIANRLENRIVIIGENDPDRDEFATIIGRIPGFYLQANYIEALLDDRYYTSSSVLDLAFAFFFLFTLELILVLNHDNPAKATGLTLGLVACTAMILYLIIKLFGYFIDPVPVSVTAIVIKLLHSLYGYAKPIPSSPDAGHH